MAENYSHLVQVTGRIIGENVFHVSNNAITIFKDILICNLDSEVRQFSLAVIKEDELLTNKSYIFKETKIDPKETISITAMWTLDKDSTIYFWSDRDDLISLNIFGLVVD